MEIINNWIKINTKTSLSWYIELNLMYETYFIFRQANNANFVLYGKTLLCNSILFYSDR